MLILSHNLAADDESGMRMFVCVSLGMCKCVCVCVYEKERGYKVFMSMRVCCVSFFVCLNLTAWNSMNICAVVYVLALVLVLVCVFMSLSTNIFASMSVNITFDSTIGDILELKWAFMWVGDISE